MWGKHVAAYGLLLEGNGLKKMRLHRSISLRSEARSASCSMHRRNLRQEVWLSASLLPLH